MIVRYATITQSRAGEHREHISPSSGPTTAASSATIVRYRNARQSQQVSSQHCDTGTSDTASKIPIASRAKSVLRPVFPILPSPLRTSVKVGLMPLHWFRRTVTTGFGRNSVAGAKKSPPREAQTTPRAVASRELRCHPEAAIE